MQKIITFINRMIIIVLISNDIDKDIITFKDTYGGYKCLFSYTTPLFYTHRTTRFITLWQLILRFILYKTFQVSWNHVAMMLLVEAFIYYYLALNNCQSIWKKTALF